MPTYIYECGVCGVDREECRRVDDRDLLYWCRECQEGQMVRRFTPTAMVLVPEHFRHDQSQFLPQEGDTAAWEARSKGSMSHAPAKAGVDFEEHLERDLRGTWG